MWSVNAPTAVEWCYATGQAEPFFFALILTKRLMEVNRDCIFACKGGNPAIIILLIFSIKGVI